MSRRGRSAKPKSRKLLPKPKGIGVTRPYRLLNPIQQRYARSIANVLVPNITKRTMVDRDGDGDIDINGDAPDNTGGRPPGVNAAGNGGNQIPEAPLMYFPNRSNMPLRGRTGARMYAPGAARRRKRFGGFSRRSFKFLRWLYHLRKKRRFTPAQAENAANRRQVFFRAWEKARGAGRKYLTGADVKAAQGGYSAAAPGIFSSRNSGLL